MQRGEWRQAMEFGKDLGCYESWANMGHTSMHNPVPDANYSGAPVHRF
jgi:hypothetical protein